MATVLQIIQLQPQQFRCQYSEINNYGYSTTNNTVVAIQMLEAIPYAAATVIQII